MFFKSLSCHKINYSLVLNKRNKHPPLLFFLEKISESSTPSFALIRTPLLTHTHIHTHTHTHKHTHTHTHTHTRPTYWFSFFLRKIRKMRFKLSNEVSKQWLFFPYTLLFIVLSHYACRFFVNFCHLNQISKWHLPPAYFILLNFPTSSSY